MDDNLDSNLSEMVNKDGLRTPSPSAFINNRHSDYVNANDNLNLEDKMEGPIKRGREEINDEIEITTWEKRTKTEGTTEVYISSKTILPKQFAFARMLKDHDIREIIKIKYLSPYKIRIDCQNSLCVEKLIECKEFINKGWKFHKAFQLSNSYGTIKNVDIDLKEEEIVKNIQCDSRTEITGAVRLKRRNINGEWIPSETVRLCFKGSFLPSYIYVDNLRIKVEPFVFPVTQCSKCWRFGHSQARCPSDKVICPKCGEKHANCNTQTFKCVNCQGDHMALNKLSCPIFLKEKRIREIMSEFNCTYRKARLIYVPQSPNYEEHTVKRAGNIPNTTSANYPDYSGSNNFFSPLLNLEEQQDEEHPTYATILKTKTIRQNNNTSNTDRKIHSTKFKKQRNSLDGKIDQLQSSEQQHPQVLGPQYRTESSSSQVRDQNEANDTSQSGVSFTELLLRLKRIFLRKDISMKDKVNNALKCSIQWLILLAVENVSDWPVLKLILDLFSG